MLTNPSHQAGKRLLLISLLVFSVAISIRLGVLEWSGLKNIIYRVETDRIALSLAEGKGYANPFNCETGPTAICPPVYPALIGLVYSLFGSGLGGELAKDILHLLVISLCLAMLPVSSHLLTGRAEPGVLAAYLGAAMGIDLAIELHGRDMGLMSIFILVSCLLFVRRLEGTQIGRREGLSDGVIYGMGVLTGAQLLPVLVVTIGLLAWHKRAAALRYIGTVAVVVAICLLPWVIRNRIALGRWILFRSNFWLEMQISNNDQSKTDVMANLVKSEGRTHHPFTNAKECELCANLGEPAYMERKRKIFLDWLKKNPGKFAVLSIDRARKFWFPPTGSQLAFPHLQWVVTILGWIGLWLLRREGLAIWRWFALLWLVYPAIYYLVQFDYRYRYPIQWTLLLCTGWAITTLVEPKAGSFDSGRT